MSCASSAWSSTHFLDGVVKFDVVLCDFTVETFQGRMRLLFIKFSIEVLIKEIDFGDGTRWNMLHTSIKE